MASKHDYELTADSYWHVHLDHRHIGSGGDDSWSPSVLEVGFSLVYWIVMIRAQLSPISHTRNGSNTPIKFLCILHAIYGKAECNSSRLRKVTLSP